MVHPKNTHTEKKTTKQKKKIKQNCMWSVEREHHNILKMVLFWIFINNHGSGNTLVRLY